MKTLKLFKIAAVNYFLFVMIIREFPRFPFAFWRQIFPRFAKDDGRAAPFTASVNKPVVFLLEQRHESQTTGTGEPDTCSQQDDCTGTGEQTSHTTRAA